MRGLIITELSWACCRINKQEGGRLYSCPLKVYYTKLNILTRLVFSLNVYKFKNIGYFFTKGIIVFIQLDTYKYNILNHTYIIFKFTADLN